MKPPPSSERQPLLATVPLSAPRARYPRRRLFARLVAILLGSWLALTVTCLLFNSSCLQFATDLLAGVQQWQSQSQQRIPLEVLEEIMQLTPDAAHAREHSRYYTSGPHLGGKNLSQALWTQKLWQSYGIDSHIVAYDIFVNYPKGHRLGLYKARPSNSSRPAADTKEHGLLFEASLEEDVLGDADPTTALKDRIPTFHGYSAKYILYIPPCSKN